MCAVHPSESSSLKGQFQKKGFEAKGQSTGNSPPTASTQLHENPKTLSTPLPFLRETISTG